MRIIMKKTSMVMVAALMLLLASQVQAIDVDFYSDATIQDGDLYDLVRLYDTPPDQTTVDMTGGSVHNLRPYDSSIINMTGGEIQTLETFNTSTANISGVSIYGVSAWDYTTVNLSGDGYVTTLGARVSGTINMLGGTAEYLGAIDSGTINIYGGLITESLGAWNDAVVNIYGYDFNYDPMGGSLDGGQLIGCWMDGSAFIIDLYGTDTYSHINLIPEPGSLMLFALGALLVRRKK